MLCVSCQVRNTLYWTVTHCNRRISTRCTCVYTRVCTGICVQRRPVDSMVQKLERYTDNLESIVQQRTAELMDEKQKTDTLLYRMLPPCVALAVFIRRLVRRALILHRVPIKTSTFYFLNISVKNQPVFTMFGAHTWPTLLAVSAVLLF